jgi:general secretion pathway protein L
MQEKLIVYLHAHDLPHPSWIGLDEACHIKQQVQRGNAAELATVAANKYVVVMVPAEDVLLTSVTLPKMNSTRLMQALPFALEEQLISEVNTLHFVPIQKTESEWAVAVVAKEKMQAWMDLLKGWNVQPDAMVPLTLALPIKENRWRVLINEMAVVRTGPYQGFACDKNNLNELLNMALSSIDLLPHLIEGNGVASLALNQSINVKEDHFSIEQQQIELAKHAVQFPTLNLLRGEYKSKKTSFAQRRNIWGIIACLTIVWVLLLALYPAISYVILHQRLNNIDHKIEEIYKRHFPHATSIVAPEMRLEEKRRGSVAQGGDNQPLVLLSEVGKGIRATPGVQLKRLDYQANQLTLDLTAASSEEFAQFTEFLVSQGLRVKQQSANLVGARINATIVIE